MTNKTLVEELRDALQAASDHLDYVGYGDTWERECAREQKLEETIAAALKRANEAPPDPARTLLARMLAAGAEPVPRDLREDAARFLNLVTVPSTLAGPDQYAAPPGEYFASIGAKGGKKKGATKKRGDAKHYRDMVNSRWDKPK